MIARMRGSRPVLRTAAVGAVSVLVVPLLLLNVYLLLWFLPELTSWGTAGHDGHPYLWLLIFGLTVAAAVCLVLAGRRRHRSARWWLWLLAAPILMLAGLPVMDRL
jgi:hypothetical protein